MCVCVCVCLCVCWCDYQHVFLIQHLSKFTLIINFFFLF